MSSSGVRVAVLGPARAWRDGIEVELGTPQQRALLCALVLADGNPVHKDQLIDILWGDDPAPTAVSVLRTYISRLRAVLGSAHLLSLSSGYALSDVDTDLARFRDSVGAGEYRLALALWRGEPFPHLSGAYGARHRSQLVQLRLMAIEAACTRDLKRGRAAEIVEELTVVAAEHPHRESARALLMRALAASDRLPEALAVFADLEHRLDTDLGLAPGPALVTLRGELVERSAPSARTAVIPAQLPPAIGDFTGRSDQARTLTDALSEGRAAVVSAVAGIGGVGKTTLAVQVAHTLRERYPDGQLYADLQGASHAPAEPADVLAAFLRALGVTDSAIPDKLAERATLLRSTLADRRVLLLLDNARDSAQVTPLLPGSPTCGVLVTSRAKLHDLANVHVIDLDLLPPAESMTLLTRIIGADRVSAEPADAERLTELCGHLPLALRVAGSRLATRPTWTLASMVAQLAEERDRLRALRVGSLAVEAAFELSYQQLDPAQGRAFRLAAVPDGPDLSLPAAAAALGLQVQEAEDLLESLVDLSLLTTHAPGRYRYHDLLRAYARQQADPEREEALERVLGFYLSTCIAGVRASHPRWIAVDGLTGSDVAGLRLETVPQAQDWAQAEMEPILAVCDQVGRSGRHRAVRLAAEMMSALEMMIEFDSRREAIAQPLRALADRASGIGDQMGEARCRALLGRQLRLMGELKQAASELGRAVRLAQNCDAPSLQAAALNDRAWIHLYEGAFTEARTLGDQAFELFCRVSDTYGQSFAVNIAVRALSALGDHEQAVEKARRMVELSRLNDDENDLAGALYQVGVISLAAGRPAEALESLAQGLSLFQATREPTWAAATLARTAAAHLALGRIDLAVQHARTALDQGRKLGLVVIEGLALKVLGQAERDPVTLREASIRFRDSGDLAEAATIDAMISALRDEGVSPHSTP